MKNFANLKALVDYCLVCPLCSKERNLSFEGDSDKDFVILNHSYSFNDSILELSTSHRYESFQRSMKIETAEIGFKINCETHTYSTQIYGSKRDITGIKFNISNLFYFYIYAHCPSCSSVDTVDFEIKNGKFVSAGIEREAFWLKDAHSYYHVEYLYKENKMYIKLWRRGDEKFSKPLILPIYELDLSSPAEAASQIKNIIAFS